MQWNYEFASEGQTCIGNNSASSKECEMHGKSKAEKDMALSEIKENVLAAEISKKRCECKCGIFYT